MDERPRNLDHLQRVVDAWIQAHGGYWERFQILAQDIDITQVAFKTGR